MFKKKKRRSREFKKNNQVIDFEEAREVRKKRREESGGKRSSKPVQEPEVERKRIKQRNRQRRMFYTAIMIVFIAVIGFSVFNIISLKFQQKELQEQNVALKKEKAQLAEEIKNADSLEYIMEKARTELNLIMPGEILYVLPDLKSSTPSGIVPDGEQGASSEEAIQEGQAPGEGE